MHALFQDSSMQFSTLPMQFSSFNVIDTCGSFDKQNYQIISEILSYYSSEPTVNTTLIMCWETVPSFRVVHTASYINTKHAKTSSNHEYLLEKLWGMLEFGASGSKGKVAQKIIIRETLMIPAIDTWWKTNTEINQNFSRY